MVAKLFRTLRLDAIVEPTRLFNSAGDDASSQRPDIFIRNPRGLGRQVIIDVAVTGVAKTASRNVAFKVAKMREAMYHGGSERVANA